MEIEHPIFKQSIQYIRSNLDENQLNELEKRVLERLIHTCGDFTIQPDLFFSPQACEIGLNALCAGAPVLTDTLMAKTAIKNVAQKTLKTEVFCALDWAPQLVDSKNTRSSIGMEKAWAELSLRYENEKSPIIIIGSAPTALDLLIEILKKREKKPSLIVGMPVGFIGVLDVKNKLSNFLIPQIRLDGTRGGAALAGATVNALLYESIKRESSS